MLNTKRTVLSLALAASLACVGNYAAAYSVSCDSNNHCTYTYGHEEILDSTLIPVTAVQSGYTYEIDVDSNEATSRSETVYGILLDSSAEQSLENISLTVNITNDLARFGYIYGIGVSDYDSKLTIDSLSLNVSSAQISDAAAALYLNDSAPMTNMQMAVGGVDASFSSISADYEGVGLYGVLIESTTGYDPAIGNISLTLANSSSGYGLTAVALQNNYGELASGGVSLVITSSYISHAAGASIGGDSTLDNSTTIDGDISVYLEYMNLNGYAAALETTADLASTTRSVTVTGDISVNIITTANQSLSGSIYGVYANGGTVTQSTGKNITISLGGEGDKLGSDFSIYGSYKTGDSTSVSVGTRTLNFSATDSTGEYVISFSSSEGYPFLAAFGGFDEVVIPTGSSLYITSDQGAVADGADGITSSEGTLSLPKGTTLTVEADASLYTPTISGTSATINNSGTITAGTFSTTFETINNSGTITADEYEIGINYDESETGRGIFNNSGTVGGTDSEGNPIGDMKMHHVAFTNEASGTVTVASISSNWRDTFGSYTAVIDNYGTFTVTTISGYSGTINNWGTMNAGSIELTWRRGVTLNNYGELIAGSISTAYGTITNYSGGSLEADSVTLSNYYWMTSRGSFNNQAGATTKIGNLTIEGGRFDNLSGAEVEISGTLHIEGCADYSGNFTNEESGHVYVNEIVTTTGSYPYLYRWELINYGIIDASSISFGAYGTAENYATINTTSTTVSGTEAALVNEEGGIFNTDSLSVTSSGTITNSGTMNIYVPDSDTTASISANFGNHTSGVVNFGLDGGKGKLIVESGGTIESWGEFNISGTSTDDATVVVESGGEFANYGTLLSTGANIDVYGIMRSGYYSGEGNTLWRGKSYFDEGTVTIHDGGLYTVDNRCYFEASQTVIIEEGGEFYTMELANATFNGILVQGTFTNSRWTSVYDNGVTIVEETGEIYNRYDRWTWYYPEMHFANLLVSGQIVGGNIWGLTTEDENSNSVTIYSPGVVAVKTMSFDTITNEGTIKNDSDSTCTLIVGKVLTNGAAEDSASINVGTLEANFGAVINAYGGTITTSALQLSDTETTDYDKVTYNQTNGTLLITESGWFEDSTLNIMGGYLDMTSEEETPTSDTLGKNTVNISKADATMPTDNPLDPNYYSNLTWVKTDTLTSDTIVNIESGGLLIVVSAIELDGTTAETLNINGGALQTSLNQIFESVGTEAILVDATDPSTGTVELNTEVLSVNAVGSVKDTISTGMTATSGNIVFTDEYISDSLLVSAMDALYDAGLGSLTINYTGTLSAPFTIDTATALQTEAAGSAPVANPGIVLNNTTLYSTSESGGDQTTLTIGTGGDIDLSIGFMNVAVATAVEISGGREFVLVGDSSGQYNYDDDASKLLIDSEDGGTVTVTDGTFTLGTLGASYSSVGWVNEVDIESGALNVKNGEFAVWTISNEGTVTVDASGTLHTTSLTGSGTVENSGTFVFDDGTETVVIGSSFYNKGTLDASNAEAITVTGTLTNEGEATLSDTLIAEGGTVTNTGEMSITALTTEADSTVTNDGTLELSDTSTIAGSITNKGSVSAADIEISETAEVENSADATWTTTGTMTVEASFTNGGVMSLAALATTADSTITNEGTLELLGASTIDGSITNKGSVSTADIEISETAAVENSADATWTTTGTMTVAATVTNEGEMSVNTLNVESDAVVANATTGAFTVESDSTVEGDIENIGDFTVNGTLTVADGGEIINSGTEDKASVMTLKSLAAEEGSVILNGEDGNLVLTDSSTLAGTLANEGTLSSADVEVSGAAVNQTDAAWTTTGTLTVSGSVTNYGDLSADNLTISGDSASVTTTGSLAVADTFSIDSGTLDIQEGTFTAGSSELDGGSVILGSTSAVSVELGEPAGEVGSQISVLNGSRLSLGSAEYGLDWADSETGSSLGNLLVVSSPITTNDTGGVSVGAEATDAGLYFSADSTLVVNVDALNGSAAFTTTSGSTATVETGATLVVGGSFNKGYSYSIIEGYTADIAENSWGYDTDDENYLYGEDTSGLKWSLHLVSEDGKIYVQAVEHEDVSNVYDLAIPDIANDDLDYAATSTTGGFIHSVLTDNSLSKEDKEKIINSAANLAFAGGVMATTMTDATAGIDSVHNHLTMDGDTFGKDGNLWPWDKNNNLWIDLLGSFQHGKHLNATAVSGYKYRTNTVGLVLGYDHKLEDRPVVLGGAFSFSDGNLKSKGGVSRTKNEYQTYGVSLFGNYSPSPAFNLIGSLHWFHNSADVKQYSSSGKVTGKVQTNLAAVGLRGETTLKAGQVNFVPHVEARYIYGKSGKFTTKFDGANAWSTKAEGTHTVQFPVGIAARTDIKTESGWNIRPKADISVIPQVGDTKQKSVVRSSDGVSDMIDGQFMGKFGGSVKLGVQADKGNATVGLRYGFLGGTKGRADHSVMLQGRIRF